MSYVLYDNIYVTYMLIVMLYFPPYVGFVCSLQSLSIHSTHLIFCFNWRIYVSACSLQAYLPCLTQTHPKQLFKRCLDLKRHK